MRDVIVREWWWREVWRFMLDKYINLEHFQHTV